MFPPVAVDSWTAPPPPTLHAALLATLGLGSPAAAAEDELTAGAASAEVCRSKAAGEPLTAAFLSLVLSAAQVEGPAAPGTFTFLQSHIKLQWHCRALQDTAGLTNLAAAPDPSGVGETVSVPGRLEVAGVEADLLL